MLSAQEQRFALPPHPAGSAVHLRPPGAKGSRCDVLFHFTERTSLGSEVLRYFCPSERLAKLPAQYDPRGLFGGDGVVFGVSSWPS